MVVVNYSVAERDEIAAKMTDTLQGFVPPMQQLSDIRMPYPAAGQVTDMSPLGMDFEGFMMDTELDFMSHLFDANNGNYQLTPVAGRDSGQSQPIARALEGEKFM